MDSIFVFIHQNFATLYGQYHPLVNMKLMTRVDICFHFDLEVPSFGKYGNYSFASDSVELSEIS